MNRSVVVFDLDDTLYAERTFALSGFAAVDRWLQQEHSLAGFDAEAGRLFAAGLRGTIFDAALRRLGHEAAPELVDRLVGIYRGHVPSIALEPDARWALDHFRGRCRLGLITDGWAGTQRLKIGALGIASEFDCIVCTDELGRENWKPSPRPFRLLMERLGCAGGQCVYVGDNPAKDFIAPNALGWLTVRIRRAGGEYAGAHAGDPRTGDAHHTVHSLREIPALLE